MLPSRRVILVAIGLLALSWAARGPAAGNDYLNFDDPYFVTENPAVLRGLTLDGLKFAFTDIHQGYNWVPLTYLSHMLDVQLFGPGPAGGHVTNIVLHGVNVVILFLLLHAMTASLWRAALPAALLAVHPIHTASVAWIAERRDVLSLLFGLLTLWAYVTYARRNARLAYALALLAFACSLMSKPMLVTLPGVMLLLDYWPLDRLRPGWRPLVEKLPFLACSIAVSVVTLAAQRPAMDQVHVNPLLRLTNIPVAYAWYLARLGWPTRLTPYYIYQPLWPAWVVIAAVLLLAAVSAVALLLRRRRPGLLVGWLWFLGSMVPVIGLVQVGNEAFACRYAYFPFIGLYIAIAWSLPAPPARPARLALAAGAAAVLAALAIGSIVQDGYWKNTQTLFHYALAVGPESALAHGNLADDLIQRGQGAAALPDCRRAFELAPTDLLYLTSLAQRYLDLDQPTAADAILNLCPSDQRDRPAWLATDAVLLLKQARPAAAVAALERAVAAAPAEALYRHQLAAALSAAGRLDDAIIANRQAVTLNPLDPLFWTNYGLSLLAVHHTPQALAALQHAVALDPARPAAWSSLAQACTAAGRFTDALACNRRAADLAPYSPEAHNNLGASLARAGDLRRAAEEFRRALALSPHYAAAADNLRNAQRLLGDPPAPPAGGHDQ